jgi:hypothetical protein
VVEEEEEEVQRGCADPGPWGLVKEERGRVLKI